MKITFSAFLILFFNIITNAQYKSGNYFEGNFAYAKKGIDFNLNWHHLHPITKNKKLKFGYGLRFTTFFGSNNSYGSAPAQIAKNTTGPAVLFTKAIPENINYVSVTSSKMAFLNTYIMLQYTFFEKIDLGFNIDVIGFGFGLKSNNDFDNIQDPGFPPYSLTQTNFNLLLIDANDIGNLKSELFVRYWISKKWAAKIAVSHLFTEVKTSYPIQTLPQENDRFRLVSDLVSVGVTFKPWE